MCRGLFFDALPGLGVKHMHVHRIDRQLHLSASREINAFQGLHHLLLIPGFTNDDGFHARRLNTLYVGSQGSAIRKHELAWTIPHDHGLAFMRSGLRIQWNVPLRIDARSCTLTVNC